MPVSQKSNSPADHEVVSALGSKTTPFGSDRVFDAAQPKVEDFKFGEKVVSVFDDMVDRSVPFYREMQRMIAEIAGDYATPGSNVYDLGCSTGTTMLCIDSHVEKDVRFVGIDNSPKMLERCRTNLDERGVTRDVDLQRFVLRIAGTAAGDPEQQSGIPGGGIAYSIHDPTER